MFLAAGVRVAVVVQLSPAIIGCFNRDRVDVLSSTTFEHEMVEPGLPPIVRIPHEAWRGRDSQIRATGCPGRTLWPYP